MPSGNRKGRWKIGPDCGPDCGPESAKNNGHETHLNSGPEGSLIVRRHASRVRQHDSDYSPQRARGPAGSARAAAGAFGTFGGRDSSPSGRKARYQGTLPVGVDGRPRRALTGDAGPLRRRLDLDTSAYLCILLGEDESDSLSEETERAELSSVLSFSKGGVRSYGSHGTAF